MPKTSRRGGEQVLTVTSIMATICYGIVPVLKKFGTENGGPPVMGALVMHATGLPLLLTLGSLLKIELKSNNRHQQCGLLRQRRLSLRHRFDPDAEGFDLRAGVGGGADLERAADRQFLLGEDRCSKASKW